MPDLWYPAGQANVAPRDRWLTHTGGPNRTVLHTTETDNFVPGSSYYGHNGWPHCTLDVKKLVIWNHIPVNYGAPTLLHPAGKPETNRLGAVQIEIVWRAYNIGNLPPAAEGLLADWLRWVEGVRGVKHHAATFVGPEASPAGVNRPQRFTWAQWQAFDGVCGHQHVPGNDHWDPGKIDIKALLGAPVPPAPTPPQPKPGDDMTYIFKVKGHPPYTFVSNGQTSRYHVSQADHDTTLWHLAANGQDTTVYEEDLGQAVQKPLISNGALLPALTSLGFVRAQ